MTELHVVLTVGILSGCLQYTIKTRNWRYDNAQILAKYKDVIYGICSGIFCIWTVYTLIYCDYWNSIESLWCNSIPPGVNGLLYIYFLSRFWEYIDIILVILMGFQVNL